jgi:hypothetical protein
MAATDSGSDFPNWLGVYYNILAGPNKVRLEPRDHSDTPLVPG